jgi:hypothetical protein
LDKRNNWKIPNILFILPTILFVFHAKGSLIETKRETIWRKPSFQGEATLSPQWVGLDWRCVYFARLIGLTGKK